MEGRITTPPTTSGVQERQVASVKIFAHLGYRRKRKRDGGWLAIATRCNELDGARGHVFLLKLIAVGPCGYQLRSSGWASKLGCTCDERPGLRV
jgi:hypothetical protein